MMKSSCIFVVVTRQEDTPKILQKYQPMAPPWSPHNKENVVKYINPAYMWWLPDVASLVFVVRSPNVVVKHRRNARVPLAFGQILKYDEILHVCGG